jgi:hypothetical protein
MTFGCLTAGGVRGGDTTQLLSWVPKNVNVFAPARVPHATFKSRTHVTPGEPVSENGAWYAGPVAMMGPRVRSQLVGWCHRCHGGLRG